MPSLPVTAPVPRAVNRLRWRRLVLAQQHGALSQREFCVAHDLTISSFTRWRRLILAESTPGRTTDADEASGPRTSAAFVPVSVIEQPPASPRDSVSVTLVSGVRIHGITSASVPFVVALVRAL